MYLHCPRCPGGVIGPCLGVSRSQLTRLQTVHRTRPDSGCRQVCVCPMASSCGLPFTHTHTHTYTSLYAIMPFKVNANLACAQPDMGHGPAMPGLIVRCHHILLRWSSPSVASGFVLGRSQTSCKCLSSEGFEGLAEPVLGRRFLEGSSKLRALLADVTLSFTYK